MLVRHMGTTHDKRLQRWLNPEDKADRVKNFVHKLEYETGLIAHSCGVRQVRALKRFHVRILQNDGKSVAMDELFPEQEILAHYGHMAQGTAGLNQATQIGTTAG